MTPDQLKRRIRMVRARAVTERIALTHRADCERACDAARVLAERLSAETNYCVPEQGRAVGSHIAATVALAERLRAAGQGVARRQLRLDDGLADAILAARCARIDRRIAEMLSDRAYSAVEAAAEARVAQIGTGRLVRRGRRL